MGLVFQILVLISAFAVIKILSEIVASRRCPNEKLLKHVIRGRIGSNTPEARQVQRHLGICNKCRNKIDTLNNENPSDHLIRIE